MSELLPWMNLKNDIQEQPEEILVYSITITITGDLTLLCGALKNSVSTFAV